MWGYAACIAIVCFNIRGWHEEAKTNHNACTSNRNIEYLPKNYSQGLDVFKESNFEPNQDNFLNNISYTPSQEWPGQHKFVPIHSQVKNSGRPKVSTPEADLGDNVHQAVCLTRRQNAQIHKYNEIGTCKGTEIKDEWNDAVNLVKPSNELTRESEVTSHGAIFKNKSFLQAGLSIVSEAISRNWVSRIEVSVLVWKIQFHHF